MNNLLSVIVPVYNMQAYIGKTLESLLCISSDDYEVIAVDDGSTDDSPEQLRQWQHRFPNKLKVISQANGGHGSAWNTGLRHASGTYIAFMDSDDWAVDFGSVVRAISRAVGDIVFFDMLEHDESTDRDKIVRIHGIPEGLHNFNKDPLPLRSNSPKMLNFHYCIYSERVLRGILFHEHTSYDDIILSTYPLARACTYQYFPYTYYAYRTSRISQSMSPSVILSKIDQQMSERIYAFSASRNYLTEHPDGIKAITISTIARDIAKTFYNFVMKLESNKRSRYLEEWTEVVSTHIPEPDKVVEYKLYRKYPSILYPLAIKILHLKSRLS